MNVMKEIKIEKVTLNIGCGDNKERIEKSKKLLEYVTGKKVVVTKSKRRNTFGVIKGKPIGVMVTLRKAKALEFLKRILEVNEKKIKASQFDNSGNFSIGIKEYIDVPGVKYQYEVGMMGFDVTVTLERAGFRIKKRRMQQRKIPANHRISKEDAMDWLKNKFGAEIIE